LVARASTSRTVTRANYNDIKGGTTTSSIYGLAGHGASRGDPSLKPIESINLDLSLEWYYGDTDYLSVGYFKKDVTNFIGTGSDDDVTLWALRDVSRGGIYEQTWTDTLSDDNPDNDLDRTSLSEISTKLGVDSDNKLESCSPEDVVAGDCNIVNEFLPFSVSYPINQKDAKVYGWELNLQHNFGESGLGVILNYTIPWSDVGYNNIVTTKDCEFDTPEEAAENPDKVCIEEQFALSGLSDSANFIGFYDKNGISFRMAWNWRDDFYVGNGQNQGALYDSVGNPIGQNPNYTKFYSQLDISASYEVNDNLTLFLDGLNVSNSHNKSYGRTERQVLGVTQTGPKYTLGFRYSL